LLRENIVFPSKDQAAATLLLHLATTELIQHKLFFTHYDTPSNKIGAGATEMGWTVIRKLWPNLARPTAGM